MLNNEKMRYIVAGIFNTVFCYAIFTIVLLFGAGRTVSMSIATVATVAMSFLVMGRYVFACELTMQRLVAYVFMHGLGYVFNITILNWVSHGGVSDQVSGVVSLAATALLTFFVSKYVVFFRRATDKP